MATYELRKATLDDFDAVFALLKQLWVNKQFDREKSWRAFERGVRNRNDVYVVAERNGVVIGFCSVTFKDSLWEDGELAYIAEIVVDQLMRGSGIGTDLIRSAMKLSQDRGCKRIELDSAFHRDAAHRFYEALGFEKRAYLFSKKLGQSGS